jgi:hypothetical protein
MSAWTDWLANPDASRALLVEVNCYSGAAEVTRYLSTHGFTTEPGDTPANQWYDNRLVGSPMFSSRMSEVFTGRSTVSWGELEIDNSDGDLDNWLDDNWDGREIIVKLGDPDWTYSQYGTILTGTVERLEVVNDSTLQLVVRDRQKDLDIPVQSNLLTSGERAGEPVPLCHGRVRNITPVNIDASTLTYQIHDGAVSDITAVYDNGAQLALSTDSCATGGYTKDLSSGKITLCSSPVGTITCDADGANPSATWLTTAGEIMDDLLDRIGPLSSADIDATALAALDTDAPYTLGLYIRERRNLLDVLDDIANSAGAYYGFKRDGVFSAAVFTVPAGSPVITLDNIETLYDLEIDLGDPPIWRQRLSHERNWTLQQGDGLAACVGTASCPNGEHPIDWLSEQYRTVSSEDTSIKTAHLLARDPDAKPTLIDTSANATTEAARLLTLHKVPRVRSTTTAFCGPYQVDMGEEVTLQDDRFGLSAGEDCRVVGITEQWLENIIELELWR